MLVNLGGERSTLETLQEPNLSDINMQLTILTMLVMVGVVRGEEAKVVREEEVKGEEAKVAREEASPPESPEGAGAEVNMMYLWMGLPRRQDRLLVPRGGTK